MFVFECVPVGSGSEGESESSLVQFSYPQVAHAATALSSLNMAGEVTLRPGFCDLPPTLHGTGRVTGQLHDAAVGVVGVNAAAMS